MIVLIVVLLLPVMTLYIYFNKVSESNTKREIQNSALGRLAFFLSQVEANVDRMTFSAGQISRDPSLLELQVINLGIDYFDKVKTVNSLYQKVQMLSSSNKWDNQITVYVPQTKDMITTGGQESDEEAITTHADRAGWVHQQTKINNNRVPGFRYRLVVPDNAWEQPETADFVIDVSFPDSSLQTMLDQFKFGNQGDPFFYNPQAGTILNRSADDPVIREIANVLGEQPADNGGKSSEISIGGSRYVIQTIYSPMLKWYLVDYYPLEKAFSPIRTSRIIFYISITMLFLMGVIATAMFYRHVQFPIRELVRGVQKLKRGDYSARIGGKQNSEFDFLFERFNDMAAEMKKLIENVYEEKLRSRDAVLKQLQSQINPHFLYNCLSFIKNMATLGNEEAVEKMAVNLGDFYRYATRSENRLAALRDELQFVDHYLSIQRLRTPKFRYEVSVPEQMLELQVPRLMLQPIVENAVIYGIEGKVEAGMLTITAEKHDQQFILTVEDDGKGMSLEKMRELQSTLSQPLSEEMGCGLWNVHQRLQLEFGHNAGLIFFASELGGLGVRLYWSL
ncbi:sensor histidine kinase [Cohnella silvisoli]|uniref:Histidine kinase n=1 Tax=Cohnella silvisoli TaxID=2873699 RepID=A0ABV1L281_9BACL|nr:histidine kinase [Cohnella silvisoli]